MAERQAKAKVEQIQKTTEAETDKQLAITRARKIKAEAMINKDSLVMIFLPLDAKQVSLKKQ